MTIATLSDVQAVYSGPEGDLWELLMGEQIHIGGFASSADLALRAHIRPGMHGIDICCALGAGMSFLVRFCGVARMTGLDATANMIKKGRQRIASEGLEGKIEFIETDVLSSPVPSGQADFVWGEDAWCYVTDKPRLVAEASRMVRPGGTIAFTDWVIDPIRIGEGELDRLLAFMKFPNIGSLDSYRAQLAEQGCQVAIAENTARFLPFVNVYLALLETQYRFDALKRIGFDEKLFEGLLGEMHFMKSLAEEGKIFQGIFVATKA